jgi:hypothetical protein
MQQVLYSFDIQDSYFTDRESVIGQINSRSRSAAPIPGQIQTSVPRIFWAKSDMGFSTRATDSLMRISGAGACHQPVKGSMGSITSQPVNGMKRPAGPLPPLSLP